MPIYVAHFLSPTSADFQGKGTFEFESESNAGSKANLHDARMKMLEVYGKSAVSWQIVKVEKKKKANKNVCDGQLQFDFRPQKEKPKRAKRKKWL